jgi:hypothetical protein
MRARVMTRTLLLLAVVVPGIVLLLCGCSSEVARRAVRNKYPKGEIVTVPGARYEFIIRDGGNIYYVLYNGSCGDKDTTVKPVALFPIKETE